MVVRDVESAAVRDERNMAIKGVMAVVSRVMAMVGDSRSLVVSVESIIDVRKREDMEEDNKIMVEASKEATVEDNRSLAVNAESIIGVRKREVMEEDSRADLVEAMFLKVESVFFHTVLF